MRLDYTNGILMYCIPTVHAFGSLSLTHTLLVQTHIHEVYAHGRVNLLSYIKKWLSWKKHR